MNQIEQILIQTIRRSLWDEKVSFPPDVEWTAVLQEAKHQTVVGIAFNGLPEEGRGPWMASVNAELANFIRLFYAQEELIGLFSASDIPLVILKGTAASVYYPRPMDRTLGDIDFIVPQDRFEQARRLMREQGYRITGSHREGRHLEYTKDGVIFELHHHFSYSDVDIEREVAEGLEHPRQGEMEGQSFPMLPRLANGLVLLSHMGRHLKKGLGLRQVIDWMMYVHREMDDNFWNAEFGPAARRIGLETLAKTATSLSRKYLGLPDRCSWADDVEDALCDEFAAYLFYSGNFGRKRGDWGTVEALATAIKRRGFFRILQERGELHWEAYKKHPILKPFCWLYQLIRYQRQWFQARSSRKEVLSNIKKGNEHFELLHKLGIQ